MILEQVIAGPLEENCYLGWEEKSGEGFLVDPGDDPWEISRMIREAKSRGLKTLKYLLLTHTHFDHILGLGKVWEENKGQVVVHEKEAAEIKKLASGISLLKVKGGEVLGVGDLKIKVIFTPGHTEGGLSFLVDHQFLFSGDLIFEDGVGRTDLGGDFKKLKESIRKIQTLPEETRVYSGHGLSFTLKSFPGL